MKSMEKGIVFNIQKMSIHDGPGIRTTVFFKGCPLRCLWCSNPESQLTEKEVACFPSRCVECGYCAQVCPKGVIEKRPPFSLADKQNCDLCGICVKECCTNGKKIIGEEYAVDELLKEILKDKAFYDSSGGGVTFSGGEPFMQAAFLREILAACKEQSLHTAIETTGASDTDNLLNTAKLLDLVYFDVKHMDDQVHRKLTSVSNAGILKNLKELARVHDNVIVRVPVIPGINDEKENIAETAAYAASLGIKTVELLPYHNLGEVKYGQLGREYALTDVTRPDQAYMAGIAEIAEAAIGERATCVSVMKSI